MRAGLAPWLAFAGCVAVWSTTWLAIAASTQHTPSGAGALRATLAAAVLLPIALASRVSRPSWREAMLGQAVGVVFIGINFILVYSAADRIPTHVAALLYATLPVQAALIGPAIQRADRLEWRAVVGGLLGALGVGIAIGGFAGLPHAQLLGAVLVVAAATASAVGSSLARRGKMDAVWLNVNANLGGAATLWVLWAAFDRRSPLPTTAEAAWATAYMVLAGSVAAFLLYFWLLRQWTAAKASYASLLASIGAVGVGLALGEPFHARILLGGGMVLAGATLCLADRRQRTPAVAPPLAQASEERLPEVMP